MAKLEHYDLTMVAISPTDFLVIEDDENEHCFKVTDVEGDLGGARILSVDRISSSDPAVRRKSKVELHPGQPVMGLVIPEKQFNESNNTPGQVGTLNNMAIAKLVEMLGELQHEAYRAPYGTCLSYLLDLGLLPPVDKQARRRLSRLLDANPELFRSRGTYVTLLKRDRPSAESPIPRPTIGTEMVDISLHHLNQGIFHLLMSGILTGGKPVRLTDLEQERKENKRTI